MYTEWYLATSWLIGLAWRHWALALPPKASFLIREHHRRPRTSAAETLRRWIDESCSFENPGSRFPTGQSEQVSKSSPWKTMIKLDNTVSNSYFRFLEIDHKQTSNWETLFFMNNCCILVRRVGVYSILACDCFRICLISVNAEVPAGWGRLEKASLLEGAQVSFSWRWETHFQSCCQLKEWSWWHVKEKVQCLINLRLWPVWKKQQNGGVM